MIEDDCDDTLNFPRNTTNSRLLLAIIFIFLAVVGSGSVAAGDLLVAPKGIVQGLTRSQMDELADAVRRGAGHISDDIFVHGSRASGTARAASDIDIAVRVGPDEFDDLIRARFGTPNPGSAKERTMLHAIRTGKIHSGEAGLRGLRKQLEELLGFDVDISVIRRGGPFDQGPRIPLGGG